ncbi:MAG TPA: ATP-binding protein [Pyrinomonadaceae bacterium]|nr:ATP-binding protein [Pyrinomonadaceae bacterium]
MPTDSTAEKRSRQPDASDLSFLSGGGEMGERMRAFDWYTSPVGPPAEWPQSLKTAVSICIGSRYPIVLWWGRPAYTMFYNDGYIPVLGVTKHPGWLGRSGRDCWKEIWSTVGPMLESVFETGVATWSEDLLLVMERNLPREEVYFTFSYSPIHGDGGSIDGIFCACYETTGRVIGERRLQTLRDLGRTVIEVKSAEDACEVAARTLESNPHDVPFALIYLVDDQAQQARLVAATGFEMGSAAAPKVIALDGSTTAEWPLSRVFETSASEMVFDLSSRFDLLPGGAWPESPERALIVPIAAPGYTKPTGFLVAGFSPRRVVDSEYRSFFELIVGHVGTAIANARAYQEERKRAEALAEIDRAKTEFFSNVSHEFRTPLTLMLGPLEDMLAERGLSNRMYERLDVAYRNSVRLLKLVNTLLDFSRLEAGRTEAVYEEVDLAALTVELASVFRSAIEETGLKFVIDCQPHAGKVFVDREMWEKIVFNLLSNAFKFTFEGEIRVTLKETDGNVELQVSDTGTGIPDSELPHLFERFHRVKGARGRSYEGSGIGLALVQELVKLHGGDVGVTSEVDRGSTFTVSLPIGSAHLPSERIGGQRKLASTGLSGEAYVEEALKWIPEGIALDTPAPVAPASTPAIVADEQEQPRPRILLADDNADMREYLRRLLASRYEVEAAADGEAALGLARLQRYDLVLSDVMMPKLDGFGLLRALRGDDRTQSIPVILLSARAGEESRVEGMGAGADDYLVKPFSARELLARVEAHLNLHRVRQDAERSLMQLMVAEQNARANAEMANRVKDEFLAMLSHELRTPLNAIIGWSHLLKKGQLNERDREHGISVIDRNAEAQRAIIDELLDVSRIVTGKLKLEKQPVDIATTISTAIDSLRPSAESKNIEIVTSIDSEAGPVSGEPVRLQQVIWNLLSNAIKFTPAGGRVTVELNVVNRFVEVTISDNGEGIEPEFLPSIFERFRQADSSTRRMHGGLGLGLSIVRSLVEMHGGEIHAASEGKGKGTTFTVTLPVLDVEVPSAATREAHAQLFNLTWKQPHKSENGDAVDLKPDLLRGVRVLTVDDQPDTRELIILALGRYGAEVRASDSASRALEMIKEWRPHVVISDIGLPEMDGYDFMRRLRELERDGERIPAIAVTGYAGAVDESKALDAGYALHLSKPIQLSELASAIAKVSGRT